MVTILWNKFGDTSRRVSQNIVDADWVTNKFVNRCVLEKYHYFAGASSIPPICTVKCQISYRVFYIISPFYHRIIPCSLDNLQNII